MAIHHFNLSFKKSSALTLLVFGCLATLLVLEISLTQTIQAAGATTILHIVKY